MAVFGQPITVTPVKSQPSQPAYAATGVYASKPVTIQLEGSDDFHQANQPTLGIRLADYTVPPVQGDTIALPQGTFTVFNVVLDGQGGADLVLRQTA